MVNIRRGVKAVLGFQLVYLGLWKSYPPTNICQTLNHSSDGKVMLNVEQALVMFSENQMGTQSRTELKIIWENQVNFQTYLPTYLHFLFDAAVEAFIDCVDFALVERVILHVHFKGSFHLVQLHNWKVWFTHVPKQRVVNIKTNLPHFQGQRSNPGTQPLKRGLIAIVLSPW